MDARTEDKIAPKPRRPYPVENSAVGEPYLRFFGTSLMKPAQLEAISRLIPAGGRVLEFGTWTGTTVSLLQERRPGVTFVSVDIMSDLRVALGYLVNQTHRRGLKLWMGDTASYHRQCVKHQLYDLVIVDADHEEESCYTDLGYAFDLVKPDGHVVVHDYGAEAYVGVKAATDRFTQERGMKVEVLAGTLVLVAPK